MNKIGVITSNLYFLRTRFWAIQGLYVYDFVITISNSHLNFFQMSHYSTNKLSNKKTIPAKMSE